VQSSSATIVCRAKPILSDYGDQNIAVTNLPLDDLFKVRAERDGFGVDIHEYLLGIEVPLQSVAEPSGHPTAFFSTIADEDLPAHLSSLSQRLRKNIQNPEQRYYLNGLVVGETELSALLFSLDIAATVEPLVPEVETIRRELIDELKTRGETGPTS
jgi:hypothetical protein